MTPDVAREVKHVCGEGKSGKQMILRKFFWLATAVAALFSLRAADLIEVGRVKVDPTERWISFPATVNMREGQVEYLLVHETGKIHESLFKTKINGKEIHAAALLLSAGAANSLKVRQIEVSWKEKDAVKRVAAADLIFDKAHKRVLKETKWAYRGSKLINGIFLAERDGSLIAIMEDREALIDQDTPDASDDENWLPANMPPGDEVEIRILFAKPNDKPSI